MLFIYSNIKTPVDAVIKFENNNLSLELTEVESGKNITYKIASTSDDSIAEKLKARFGEGLEIKEFPTRQYVKPNEGFVGYTVGDDDNIQLIKAVNIDHKPSPEEMVKITPRNMIIVVTDEDTTLWTHKNNVHDMVPINKQTIEGFTFTRIVPKWNNWKVLKFPASILMENEAKRIKEKLVLGYTVHKRKDTSKYHMNNIEVKEWGEKDKIFKPKDNNSDNKDNKKGFDRKSKNDSRRQRHK